jgi:phospholipid/cholesterol/gamma-HCH transport system substrate-binding protein
VGAFALAGLGVLCSLVFLFGGGRMLFADTYNINVHFPQGLTGVQSGQGVTLYGKRIGETQAVDFWNEQRMEEGVKVIVAVENKYELPRASEMIVATSIMGIGRPTIQLVVLDPKDARKIPKDGTGSITGQMVNPLDQVVSPHMQSTFEAAAKNIGELAAALKPAGENLARLLEARDVKQVDVQQLTANLDTVIQRFDLALKNMNVILGDEQNQANLKDTLANARKMSESGAVAMQNISAMTEDGRATMKDASVLIRKLAGTADDLSGVLKRMDQTLALLNDKQGSLGLMLNDNRLYEEMVLSARRLTKALDDLREVLDLAKQGKLRIKAF